MEIIINPTKETWPNLCKRPEVDSQDLEKMCREIFWQVKKYRDEAVTRYTLLFDKVELTDFVTSKNEIENSAANISDELKQAIQQAKENISKFHQSQKLQASKITTSDGVECWQETRPIEKVGLYIPGGSAPLFSSVLMLAIPAKIAGCNEIILCTPPNKEGKVADEILYTARLCGIDKIYKIGGIQAIAAMCIGTESIPAVNKIYGPGNQYVTAAKLFALNYGTAIDMPAGPSEVMVVADETAIPEFVAADLLSQAEHGADSQVILVSTSLDFINKVQNKIFTQLVTLPRQKIAELSILNSKLVCLSDMQSCLDFANQYAPEHLIVSIKETAEFLSKLCNAGSVFIGNYTPESAGDYASGTNHTLPTNGYAKAYSGLSLDSFTKKITFQKISYEGLRNIGNTIMEMAKAEKLEAHRMAVKIRLEFDDTK